MTVVYFVRHAHSVYSNDEYNRPLSEKGFLDAYNITQRFKQIDIHAIYSSPYKRAIQTIEGIANMKGLPIKTIEALKERTLGFIQDNDFHQAVKKVWHYPEFSFESGESNNAAQQRAIEAFLFLLNDHTDKQIIIATHGNILTLLLNYFDNHIGYEFWKDLQMPAIIKCGFQNNTLIHISTIS
ncbi:histidine phosphatase family protein [Lysinibacillus sp. NPDC097195]|uniref:histidine phosphatase family protein n=1 Tax=Lysinibacillus sp. NPDC097195 TaxID=3364141 RepID=UPI0037FF3F51